jgi:hypothetical protein
MKVFNYIIKFSLSLMFTFGYLIAGENPVKTSTDVDGIGTGAMTFLEIGVGARAMGMGGAFVAVANDASATFWNPAGIVWTENVQLELSHNVWFLDSKLQTLSGVLPLPQFNSSIALSIITMGFGEQAVRTVDRPTGTGEMYDARDYSVGLTWATAVTDRFSFGITAKYLTSRIWHETADAFALDFGIFYNTVVRGLRLGFSMANFGSSVQYLGRDLDSTIDPDKDVENFDRVPANFKTDSYPLPILFRAGISYELNLDDFGNAIFAADLLHPSHSTEAINVGMEYGFRNMFFIRAGYENLFDNSSINGLTLGGGIDYYDSSTGFGARFDYSWADWGNLKNAQRFSVGIIF